MLVLSTQKLITDNGYLQASELLEGDKDYSVCEVKCNKTTITNAILVKDCAVVSVTIGDIMLTLGKDTQIKTTKGFKPVRYLNESDRITTLAFGEHTPVLLRIIGKVDMVGVFSNSKDAEITIGGGFIIRPVAFGLGESEVDSIKENVECVK